jgi:hypothetical protein
VAVLKGSWLQNMNVHDVVRGILHFEILAPKTSHDTSATWHPGWGDVVINDICIFS